MSRDSGGVLVVLFCWFFCFCLFVFESPHLCPIICLQTAWKKEKAQTPLKGIMEGRRRPHFNLFLGKWHAFLILQKPSIS